MSSLKIYDMTGAAVGEVEVADELVESTRGAQAVKDVITAFRNASRAGTASTLHKSAVAGSNRKPWKQKGLGRARAGLRQSPIWRGGAVVFGPKPRDYSVKVNRKVSHLAFRRAMGDVVRDGRLRVVDRLALSEPRTRLFAALMKALKVAAPVLFIVDAMDRNLSLSSRNVAGVEVVGPDSLTVYQLVRYPTIVATSAAVESLRARLQATGARKPAQVKTGSAT